MSLSIRFKKKPGGVYVLECERIDGSKTWKKYERHGVFFALHDLMHYAVESELCLHGGFFGLLRTGWDITDFGDPWPKGRIPSQLVAEADIAEHLSGALGLEQSTRQEYSVGELISTLSENKDAQELAAAIVDDQALSRIRATFTYLAGQWMGLAPDEVLTLSFDPPRRELS